MVKTAQVDLHRPGWLANHQEEGNEESAEARWHVLWTRSHCERLVYDQLAAKGFDLFLPMLDVWSRRGGLRHLSRAPLFPGYLFIHQAIDKTSYIEVCSARGLVRLLGERWDRPAVVPESEIDAIPVSYTHLTLPTTERV